MRVDAAPPRRESSIDVNLPELGRLLDRWRVPTVPIASRGVPPHVSLLYPWRPAPLRSEDLVAAEAALAGIAPLTIRFARVGRYDATGVLYLEPDPEAELRTLMRRLAAAFPDTPPYGGRFPDPAPHCTVARGASAAEVDRLEGEIGRALAAHLPLVVRVDAVDLSEQDDDGVWSVRATIALGRPEEREGAP